MKKLLLLLVSFSLSLVAQQTNTVYLQLASKITANPGTLSVTNNIGQQFHTFAIVLSGNASLNACGDYPLYANYVATVEVSYDGTNYSPLPQTKISYVWDNQNYNTSSKYYRAAGAYPYIRLVTNHFPDSLPSGCTVSIGYTGSLTGDTLNDGSTYNSIASSYSIQSGASCNPIVLAGNVDPDSPIQFAIVGMMLNLQGTGNVTSIWRNSTCSGGANLIFNGPTTITLLPDYNNDPIIPDAGVIVGGLTNLYLKVSGTSTITDAMFYWTVLN